MWNIVLVFFGALAIDWLWTRYIIYAAKKEAFKAACLSVLLALIGAFVLISFVQNHMTIIADAIGAFIGTYLSIRYSKREEK